MTTDQQTLEQIVAAAVQKHLAASIDVRPPETDSPAANGVYLTESVITADLLQEKVGGHGRFQVSAKAILTPSAQDLIREKRWKWTRAAAAGPAATPATFLAAVVTAGPPVIAAVEQLGSDWKLDLLDNPGTAARAAVSAVSRGEYAGVAIICGRPRLAACLANRSPKVRAAVVNHGEDVGAAVREMGANVIAVDPAGLGMFAFKTLLQRFSKQEPQPPANWDTISRLW